jgi:hypothetical protein
VNKRKILIHENKILKNHYLLTANYSKISSVRGLVSKQIRKVDEHILQIMHMNEET